jgi:glucans biosynthesis protein
MTRPLSRRTFLASAATTTLLASLAGSPVRGWAANDLILGKAEPFSFDILLARARERAKRPYVPPYRPAPDIVEQIDYEAHGKIRFRTADALFTDRNDGYPVTFFHIGRYFQKPVQMHVVEEGMAREIVYSPDYFDMPADSIARRLPPDAGFVGFRLQESRHRADWPTQDWVAFLGASYFRAIGALGQYGLSARGVAVDVAAPGPEEFPDFIAFYIAPAADENDPVMVYALLDGPSITGAYHFSIRRTEGVVMDVRTALFLRRGVHRLGIAPLTSMFWYAEYNRGHLVDWRPEVHDSDGFALWSSNGERIWRPLNNPNRVITSSFLDDGPRGFGLLQRDRNFEDYLDGVNYHRRPSLWVEPLGNWGRGAVQLVEIPTNDEIHDNIVAFWVPQEPARAGMSYDVQYRLHWLADEPYPAPTIARIQSTRIGRGGQPGLPRPDGVWKFVITFAGGPLDTLPRDVQPEPVISALHGEVSYVLIETNEDAPGIWRTQFDLAAVGADPVELRVYLRSGDRTLTETWLYQFLPPPSA